MYNFFPNKIRQYCENMKFKNIIDVHDISSFLHDLNLNNIKFNIQIYTKSKNTKNVTDIDIIKFTIIDTISYIVKHTGLTDNLKKDRIISIDYFPTNFKKLTPLPSIPKKYITEENINSAFTQHYDNNCLKITIFRKEELKRTIIHELMHALGIHCVFKYEGSTINVNSKNKLYYSNLNILNNSKILFDEGLVEAWTTLIYIDKTNKNNKTLLKKEIAFSCFQTAKLVMLFGYSDIESFLRKGKYESNTNVFSYYILKSALLSDLNLFQHMFSLNFIHKCNIIHPNMLNRFFENKKWVQRVNFIIKNYNKYPTAWKKSMRMTYPHLVPLTSNMNKTKKKLKKVK